MRKEVVAQHDSKIFRRGWPKHGEVHFELGEPVRYESRRGAQWLYLGVIDGTPIWLLDEEPFLPAEVDGDSIRVHFPGVKA
ncbi:hypothetical protein [Micromonospora sp. NBC_01813]|uniref:hypothetical protein n=1 Tax=Micromonospora sp. NBC_01813 TaxID=2975988 RepID=UPI002DD95184|nr:hypothetical protein [Micromonospora sp. NBC_01813]WSA11581.1 hypothetical protein OG958_12800 [Micromonospora sp. NBC_01813]